MPDELEILFGGSAGPGKSSALLMAALQFIEVPGYAAILFRRTYTDLSLPEALMDRANSWLQNTDAKWSDRNKTWTFPSGATLSFGYLESENDKYRYQSSAFQYIGFDELTQFTESQYLYLYSRLRRLKTSYVPLRMRAASNPGGVGHEWVKNRFDVLGKGGKPFIPARLEDNPYIDQEEYRKSLNELDPVTRSQLLYGDWSVRHEDGIFKRDWFEVVEDYPHDAQKVRYWDLAATEPKQGKDPDFTVGVLMAEKDGIFYIVDVIRERALPLKVERLVRQAAELDGVETKIYMEQEPGSSGVAQIDHYARNVLKGFYFMGVKTTGSKLVRAQPLSAAAEHGNIKIVRGWWNEIFLDEVVLFPQGLHDDQVDAASGAFEQLARSNKPVLIGD